MTKYQILPGLCVWLRIIRDSDCCTSSWLAVLNSKWMSRRIPRDCFDSLFPNELSTSFEDNIVISHHLASLDMYYSVTIVL
jgi:hypothetical protein